MNVHIFLEAERKRLQKTQEEMAELGGVKPRTYAYYASGERMPDAAFLVAIAAAGADVQLILTGEAPALRAEQERAGYSVEVLSKEEQALLDNYRHAPPDGRAALETTSAALAQSSVSKKRAG
jgi:transcriptional regulator with XRE-family HTH domain